MIEKKDEEWLENELIDWSKDKLKQEYEAEYVRILIGKTLALSAQSLMETFNVNKEKARDGIIDIYEIGGTPLVMGLNKYLAKNQFDSVAEDAIPDILDFLKEYTDYVE